MSTAITRRPGLRVERTLHRPGAPTRAACEAGIALGISLDALAAPAPHAESPPRLDLQLRPGAVTLIGGPSGAGKSTLLRDTIEAARGRGWTIVGVDSHRTRAALRSAKAAVDLFPRGVDHAMRTLARAGLAEAGVFVRRAHELSEGQRARLALAIAMERAQDLAQRHDPSDVLLALDEFAATLDRVTAASVARLVVRLASDTGIRVAIATPRDDLEWALEPSEIVALDGRAGANVTRVRARLRRGPIALRIIEGQPKDYHALAHLHYRAAEPATIALVLSARDADTGELAGVLLISHPTLNGAWRDRAWPGRFSTGDRRRDAQRVNRELRCISRVIVDPRYRSLGVARAMVEAYLARPLTPRTEALAAMGGACPFFEAAGMRRIEMGPHPRDTRLLEALRAAGLARWRLTTPRAAWDRLARSGHAETIQAELRAWANGSRASRRLLRGPVEAMFERACRDVGSSIMAYAHDHDPPAPGA